MGKKVLFIMFVFLLSFSCSKSSGKITVNDVVSSEFFKLEMDTFSQWEVLIASSEISDEGTKALVVTSVDNFKKIKEYFSLLKSSDNTALNDAVKNQIDLCGEYEKMEVVLNKENDVQKVMKYFYFANSHYKLFLDNIEKAKNYEDEMEKLNEKK